MGDSDKYDMNGVSIIIPAFKSVDFIGECLISIENQTYFKDNDNFEVIVGVDGCNDTLKYLEKIKDGFRNLKILWMEENMGSYVTVNTLIPETKFGHIIKFDSDDIMKPNLVEVVMKNTKNSDIIRFRYQSFSGKNYQSVSGFSSSQAMGVLYYKKSLFDLCGGYSNVRFSSDLELLTRVNDFVKILLLDDYLFYYRTHINNLTHTVPISERIKVDRIIRSNKYTKENVKISTIRNIINERKND